MPQALTQLLEKLLPYLQKGGKYVIKYGKELVAAIIVVIITWKEGKKNGREEQRVEDDKRYNKLIKELEKKLTDKQAVEIAEIIAKYKDNEETLKRKVNEYLKAHGIDSLDF